MSQEPPPPQRLAVVWAPGARSDIRAIDRKTAIGILHCLDRYLLHLDGDVKRLQPPHTGFRLRCGDYRLFFDLHTGHTIHITAVRHRRDAYR